MMTYYTPDRMILQVFQIMYLFYDANPRSYYFRMLNRPIVDSRLKYNCITPVILHHVQSHQNIMIITSHMFLNLKQVFKKKPKVFYWQKYNVTKKNGYQKNDSSSRLIWKHCVMIKIGSNSVRLSASFKTHL